MLKRPRHEHVAVEVSKAAAKIPSPPDSDPQVQLEFPHPIFGAGSYNPQLQSTIIFKHAMDFRAQLVIGDEVAWIDAGSIQEKRGKIISFEDHARVVVSVRPLDADYSQKLLTARILRAIR